MTDEADVTINKTITLNTNGKTITRNKAGIKVTDSATFSVINTGSIIAAGNVIKNYGLGSVIVDGPTLKGLDSYSMEQYSNYPTIWNNDTGTVEVKNGYVTGGPTAISNNGGTVNIKGGNIEGRLYSNVNIMRFFCVRNREYKGKC